MSPNDAVGSGQVLSPSPLYGVELAGNGFYSLLSAASQVRHLSARNLSACNLSAWTKMRKVFLKKAGTYAYYESKNKYNHNS